MTNGQETLLAIAFVAAGAGAAYSWFSDKSKKLKEDKLNRELRQKLEADRLAMEQEAALRARAIEAREAYIAELQAKFDSGILPGRRWLASFIAEADRALDESISEHLRDKKRPAHNGLGSGLASCHWEAALTAREASQRKQAGKWQDLTPAICGACPRWKVGR